jgi:predicted aconitase/predicted aconitase with swiveling domain
MIEFDCDVLVQGRATAPIIYSPVPLSFWGGVDPESGLIIDQHHPLAGQNIAGKVLVIPRGRGSCTGSGVFLELALNGNGPAALIFCETEEILTLGSVIADVVFEKKVPIYETSPQSHSELGTFEFALLQNGRLTASRSMLTLSSEDDGPEGKARLLNLTKTDEAMLSGDLGRASEIAMQLIVRMTRIFGVNELIDVSQVHIDGCCYNGPAGLRLAQLFAALGGKVRVPTTMNSISVDRRRWRELGVSAVWGEPSDALADAYVAMGARPTYTCAPYLLETAPSAGEHVGWAESNAVVYANSVLGARTMKYPDYLDLCIALTGRAPKAGCHLDDERKATLAIDVHAPVGYDDAFWPLLGYCCGALAGQEIPLIRGLEACLPSRDDLKAFGAAFATLASAPMFHIAGITPEADAYPTPTNACEVRRDHLQKAWHELNSCEDGLVDVISLGNPHFSITEFEALAKLIEGRKSNVAMIITCGRDEYEKARLLGYVEPVETFGATIINDTCWCMIGEPIVFRSDKALMTNSAKYAHYAPGLVGRRIRFGNLRDCVDAACTGTAHIQPPVWLNA